MSFLRNRLFRRFSPLGRIADIALVGGVLVRLAQRKGWVNDDQVARFGLSGASSEPMALPEMALALGAGWRLLRRKKTKRRR